MKARLNRIVDSFPQLRLLVLGDFLLDEFVYGEISRLSREAPVLILGYRDTLSTPGGGANAVAGVAALGATVVPVGFLGEDPWGDTLLSLWPTEVEKSCVFRDSRLQTTRKTRVLAGSQHSFRQQVVRIDYEHTFKLSKDDETRVAKALSSLIPSADAVIVSDYRLGNVSRWLRTRTIELCRRHVKPVVVDSRFDPAGFPGATCITPNITEVEAAVGSEIGQDQDLLEKIGRRLRNDWKLESLLITRGRHGMSLFEDNRVSHIPIYGTDQVVDVTGAGDTVIATYTTALAAGASFLDAARLANLAAGIVVTKRGTATVSSAELRAAVDSLDD